MSWLDLGAVAGRAGFNLAFSAYILHLTTRYPQVRAWPLLGIVRGATILLQFLGCVSSLIRDAKLVREGLPGKQVWDRGKMVGHVAVGVAYSLASCF